MSQRVVIDARMVTAIPHGIARYVSLLARGLSELSPTYEPVFLVDPSSYAGGKSLFGFRTEPVPIPFLSPNEWWRIPSVVSGLQADLFHSPSFASFRDVGIPTVMTVHDLNHLTWGGLPHRLYYRCLLKPALKRARQVVAVSEFSKREIQAWLGPSVSVEVVENAVPPEFGAKASDGLHPGRAHGVKAGQYLLFVSNEKAHKRGAFLRKAYQAYRERSVTSALPLVTNLLSFKRDEGVVSLGQIPEKELASWMRGARGVVFPSAYEGFGLPPLEAAVSGSAVALSDIPAHREALRHFQPRWVRPDDLAGWVEAMGDLTVAQAYVPEKRQIEAALQAFSPLRLATAMDHIYRRVLAS